VNFLATSSSLQLLVSSHLSMWCQPSSLLHIGHIPCYVFPPTSLLHLTQDCQHKLFSIIEPSLWRNLGFVSYFHLTCHVWGKLCIHSFRVLHAISCGNWFLEKEIINASLHINALFIAILKCFSVLVV
jgi:hypothetical protein